MAISPVVNFKRFVLRKLLFSESRSVVSNSLRPHGLYSVGLPGLAGDPDLGFGFP